jgi:hypothetical protein
MVAQQQQWQQASSYFLQSLEIDIEYNDNYKRDITLRSLARLWQTSSDKHLPAAIAPILDATVEETETFLREMLDDESNEDGG